MEKTPILNELLSFEDEKYTKFFMPSHLQLTYKDDFSATQKKVFKFMKNFEDKIFSFDVTEVNNFDNLSNPSGIIKQSQEIMAKSFNSKDAFFLVNGSTVGILSMICAVTEFNDKIIIQKNSHKSVHNACKINKLNVVYIKNEKNKYFDVDRKFKISQFENLLKEHQDAKAVVITSSNYYGQDLDVKKLSEIAHKHSMYFLVDCAHCANYNYSKKFPHFPINYADIVVTSFHKTLPCINQTAVLFTNKNLSDCVHEKLREQINIFQTTSPSYILLSNIEVTNYILKKYGEILYSELFENIKRFKRKIFKLSKNNHIIKTAYNYLKDKKILAEMANKKSMVFICNIFHTRSDFDDLFFALKSLIKTKIIRNNIDSYINNNSKTNTKNNNVIQYVEQNFGNKSDYNIYLYPPGTPFLIKGDILTDKILKHLKKIDIEGNVEIIF